MSKQTDVRHKTGPVMTGEGLGRDIDPPERMGPAWQSMENSPKDGLPTWLKSEDGKIIEAYWRRTRQYRKGMWQDVYFWAIYGQNPQAVAFAPALWTRDARAD